MKIHRVVISGGPCSGKTTLIDELSKIHPIRKEVAREIIKKELSEGGTCVPWIDNECFSTAVLKQQNIDFESAERGITFYDRGFADVLGYMKFYGQEHLTCNFDQLMKNKRYHNQIFLLPPWKDIYVKDDERKEEFEEAEKIYEYIKSYYSSFGYEIVTVPHDKLEKRANFIIAQLDL